MDVYKKTSFMDNYDLGVINAKQFLNTAAVAGYVQN